MSTSPLPIPTPPTTQVAVPDSGLSDPSSTKRAMDSIAPYLEKFSPVTSASESTSLKSSIPLFSTSTSDGDDSGQNEDFSCGSSSKSGRSSASGFNTNNYKNYSHLNDDAPQGSNDSASSSTISGASGVSTSENSTKSNGDNSNSDKKDNTKKDDENDKNDKCDNGDDNQPPKLYGKVGICAMDAKVLSKPCREILNRLIKFGEFETVIFGEKSILDESIESWPVCDFLISFFSNGFPLDKAIDYANLRKPFLINDLIMQKVLWDRRLCLRLLEAAQVATPERLEISRDGGPVNFIRDDLKQKLINKGVNVDPIPEPEWKMLDDDTLWVDGKIMEKPFVEKPVDGEDHNVYIYYPSSTGGGGRRLFRKVGNKSSEFDASLTMIRTNGSFIYEKFMDTENLEDVKAYTVGQYYCHAETRKSPVVDGIVRRNTRGKELRYVTTLSESERQMAQRVSKYFDQTICGFDILRAYNRSYVIDVNGFSFVKDNYEYYDQCSQILREIFKKVSPYYQITRALEAESEGEVDDLEDEQELVELHEQQQEEVATAAEAAAAAVAATSGTAPPPQTASPLLIPATKTNTVTSPTVSSSLLPKNSTTNAQTISSSSSSAAAAVAAAASTRADTLNKVKSADNALPAKSRLASESAANPNTASRAKSVSAGSHHHHHGHHSHSHSHHSSRHHHHHHGHHGHTPYPSSSKWTFKGLVTVIRHADRTPKQKFKYSFRSPIFISLLKGHKEEVIIRQVSDLQIVLQTIKLAEEQKCEAPEKLRLLSSTLEKKIKLPGTKIQLKPVLDELTNEVEKVQFILKWGGEPTHSARYQAIDLGETTRQDVQLLNKEAFKNVKVYTSSERRVIASAKLWACSFLEKDQLPEDFLKIRKDLLDDSNAAKDLMDKVKKKIKPLLRQGIKPPKQFAWPPKYPDPYYVTKRVVELMNYHRKVMDYNFKHKDIETLQHRWCCSEDPYLFKERWDKLFKEFVTFEKVDPSKISELYDTMKFDALHNREFLENIFYPPDMDLVSNDEDLRKLAEDFKSSPVLCDSYPINVLAMNNFQLPSEVSSSPNSNTASRSSSSVKLTQQAQQAIAKNNNSNNSTANSSLANSPLASSSNTSKYLTVNPSNGNSTSNTTTGATSNLLVSPRLHRPSISSASASVSPINSSGAGVTATSNNAGAANSSNNIYRVPSNDSDNYTSAGSLGWILKSDYHTINPRIRSPFDDPKFHQLRELYKLAKVLFDFVCPQEYGIENNEKLDIGLLTSLPLAKQVLSDITDMVETSNPATVAYFTKESHIYTLLNIIYESKLPMRIERNALPELDYLSQIVFELYESDDVSAPGKKKHSIRLSLSPGCHTQDPLDVQLDAKHYISNIPKISLTRHLDTDLLIQKLRSRFSRVSLPKKFIPVNISSPLVAARLLEEEEMKDKEIPSIDVGVSSVQQ